jgi:hypothetical protein
MLGNLSNTDANTRVGDMFQVWESVPTASIGFNAAGPLKSVSGFSDGDVNTMAEFDAVEGSCGDERQDTTKQSPIVYDSNGGLFTDLGFDNSVIGFAGPCLINVVGGVNRIAGGIAALNGKFQDGNMGNGELSENEFDAVFIHEFGHFSGLDHSQVNLNCLTIGCANFSDDVFGLPTMFPILISGLQESSGVHPLRTLAQDDEAWISFLYPAASFASSFGTIRGDILFSDGVTHLQGANIIARQLDNAGTSEDESRRNAVSVASGYLFTGNPGQSVTGTNPSSNFGSRDPTLIGFYEIPLPPGNYTVEVEAIDASFVDGSSLGPLGPSFPDGAGEQLPLPGPVEFWNVAETSTDVPTDSNPVTVAAGVEVSDIDIIMNGTPDRFDVFESGARLWLRVPSPLRVRKEIPFARLVPG